MTISLTVVESIVKDVIDELNESAPPNKRIEKTAQTVLYGTGSTLDSLGLVNLIIALEGHVSERFGVAITLADEKAMSIRNSPFRTVGSLCEYTYTLICEQQNQ
jgi:acyl carrier protein